MLLNEEINLLNKKYQASSIPDYKLKYKDIVISLLNDLYIKDQVARRLYIRTGKDHMARQRLKKTLKLIKQEMKQKDKEFVSERKEHQTTVKSFVKTESKVLGDSRILKR